MSDQEKPSKLRIHEFRHRGITYQVCLEELDGQSIAWAREHHLPETAWTVPVEVGRALRAADQE